MSELIITGADIFTNDVECPIIHSGCIAIQDEIIIEIGDFEQVRNKFPDARIENLGNGLITPGLVNLHHHLYSSFARGWNPGGVPPENFPQILERIWWKLDKALQLEDIYYSAMVGLCESIRMGVTAVVDHHASQNHVSGSLENITKAYTDIGLKGSICFEITDREGEEIFNSGLTETLSNLEKLNKNSNNTKLKAMIGLHASMTLSDESLEKIYQATKEFNTGYHFHLAEDKSDQDDAIAKYGLRVTERLAKHKLLGDKCLAIHGIHLNDNEIKLLKDTGTNLVLCPRSNQNNAVGFPKWWNYEGVNLGLGTDGIGSDIIAEAKSALFITHHDYKKPDFGFSEISNMLLRKNPDIFKKVTGFKTGKIACGYPADIVFWNYDSPTPINQHNINGHFLYGLYNHHADTVWIDGKKIYAKNKFLELDYPKLMLHARKLAEQLWKRI